MHISANVCISPIFVFVFFRGRCVIPQDRVHQMASCDWLKRNHAPTLVSGSYRVTWRPNLEAIVGVVLDARVNLGQTEAGRMRECA